MSENNRKNNSPTKTKILDHAPEDAYTEGQEVQLTIKEQTDLGYKAIVDHRYWGVLYYNEVFKPLKKNQEIVGYIKKVREDRKLDLTLYQKGSTGLIDIAQKILDQLEQSNGFLNITDKTDPEIIYDLFGVSKKKFKMTLGGLYKKRIIRIEEDGIYLVAGAK